MNYRQLGKTGLDVSELGFGCGAVGGILVRGDRQEMLRTVARAIELGLAVKLAEVALRAARGDFE